MEKYREMRREGVENYKYASVVVMERRSLELTGSVNGTESTGYEWDRSYPTDGKKWKKVLMKKRKWV